MERLTGTEFTEPADPAALAEEPLVIHQRTEPTRSGDLVVFVHGLGGSRYGATSTWRDFPKCIFEDLPNADVGLYQYRSGAGRLDAAKSVPLEVEARILADLVRDELDGYRAIVLLGHSMGGLLCKAMIHHLVGNGDRDTLARIAGLVLMATPQLGSLRVPSFLSFLSEDARALEPHGDFIGRINRTFEDHIALDEDVQTLRKVTIPTWSVEAGADRWVDPLSAGIGLPSSRRKVVRGSHTSIVKPRNKSADTYLWVRERIGIALRRYAHDVFIAAAMAGHKGDPAYQKSRETVLRLIELLEGHCGYRNVFYAGANIPNVAGFDPEILALQLDLRTLRESRNFILYYPEPVASSVLYEAGWALVLGKPSLYLTRLGTDGPLPFLLNEAPQAFKERRVRIFRSKDDEDMLNEIKSYGDRLFEYGEAGETF